MQRNEREEYFPLEQFLSRTGELVPRVGDSGRRFVIYDEENRVVGVLMGSDDYEQLTWRETMDPVLVRSIEEADRGETIPHEQVMKMVEEIIRDAAHMDDDRQS
jgi:PHD/YefM family antitoxin component YafN of YafNO toxin-antitoxin module